MKFLSLCTEVLWISFIVIVHSYFYSVSGDIIGVKEYICKNIPMLWILFESLTFQTKYSEKYSFYIKMTKIILRLCLIVYMILIYHIDYESLYNLSNSILKLVR